MGKSKGVAALSADPVLLAGGVSPQSLSEWRMQNIARDSENSSEEEFFDAHGMAEQPRSTAVCWICPVGFQWGTGVWTVLGSPMAPSLPSQRICLTAMRSLPRR